MKNAYFKNIFKMRLLGFYLVEWLERLAVLQKHWVLSELTPKQWNLKGFQWSSIVHGLDFRDRCTGSTVETHEKADSMSRSEGADQLFYRLAQAKSAGGNRLGHSDPSPPSKLGRILCQYTAL